MDLLLKGRPVVVLGAGPGLGQAICTEFAIEGAIVSFLGRSDANLNRCVEAIKGVSPTSLGLACKADACDEAAVISFISDVETKLGPISAGVCNVGPFYFGSWESLEAEDWVTRCRENILPLHNLCKAVVPQMKKLGEGSIVHIGSISAFEPGGTATPDHGFFKLGALNFVKRLANEVAADGIRINTVVPGVMRPPSAETAFWQRFCRRIGADSIDEALNLYCAERVPMKRPAQPTEVAKMVVILASRVSSYVTGHSLIVDGGKLRNVVS
jgi:NAD(P)-dependent dehydrogenase (short-subunit alcohol dehydrogenase family)